MNAWAYVNHPKPKPMKKHLLPLLLAALACPLAHAGEARWTPPAASLKPCATNKVPPPSPNSPSRQTNATPSNT